LKKILIVDDSSAIRRMLRTILEVRSDWKVCGEAENGREGIDQALHLSPDLIVLDLAMPVMNGFQAARELRRLLPKVPILMYTTYDDWKVRQEALASGVAEVRSKSSGMGPLVSSIQHLLKAA
jgi:DNA-binding NarL/FixJ family response regulator